MEGYYWVIISLGFIFFVILFLVIREVNNNPSLSGDGKRKKDMFGRRI